MVNHLENRINITLEDSNSRHHQIKIRMNIFPGPILSPISSLSPAPPPLQIVLHHTQSHSSLLQAAALREYLTEGADVYLLFETHLSFQNPLLSVSDTVLRISMPNSE